MARLIQKIRDVARHGLLVQTFFDALMKLGIEITPYYLVEESSRDLGKAAASVQIPDLSMRLLTEADVPALISMPEGYLAEFESRDRLRRGVICFGAFAGTELISFTWADLDQLDFNPCRRPLEKHEAYLFGAKTSRAYRGKNLSPAMRTELYSMLAARGRHRLLSISYAFNTPAVRFKKKLNAKFTRLYLFIRIGKIWQKNFLLKMNPNA